MCSNLVAGPGQGCCCSAQNHFSHREENLLKFRPGTNFLHLSGEQFNLQINFPVISHFIVTVAHAHSLVECPVTNLNLNLGLGMKGNADKSSIQNWLKGSSYLAQKCFYLESIKFYLMAKFQ